MEQLYALIMAGGGGERFWPLSSEKRPKQFLSLFGPRSLLQESVERIVRLLPWERILVATRTEYRSLVEEQLPQLPRENLILEPIGKDTAPCLGLTSLILERRDPEAWLLALPADHHIPDVEPFLACLQTALKVIEEDGRSVVTLGIKPTRPETGYGYLQVGLPLPQAGAFRALRFTEKPDPDKAQRFLQKGCYLWNSGIFLFKNRTLQQLLAKHLPEHWAGFCRIQEAWGDEAVLAEEFTRFPKISIDYGVLEKAQNVVVVEAIFPWDDLGAWDALTRALPPGEGGNVVVGRHIGLETEDCLIYSSGRPVGTIGIKGLVVVEAEGGVLVCPKERVQDVKQLVKLINGER